MLYDLGREERTTENMDMSDGLLLQVNNGEQWCNHWKYPNDDLVSHIARLSHLCDAFTPVFDFTPFVTLLFILVCILLLQGPKYQPICPALCG